MPKSLVSVDSRKARARKRGETEEAYHRRIARLDAKRASNARSAAKRAEAPPESNTVDTKGNLVLERFLEEQERQRRATESQVAELVKQLERERAERALLEARLSTRNHVVQAASSDVFEIRTYSDEITRLSEDMGHGEPAHEIIEEIGDTGQDPEKLSRISGNTLNLKEDSDDGRVVESDPVYITLKGYIDGAVHGPLPAPNLEQSENEEAEKKFARPRIPTLGEVGEMLLWVGWVHHARRAFPHRTLAPSFGEVERRIWRDAVRVAALGDEVDLDAPCGPLDVVPALTRTLSEALTAFPPATEPERIVSRCLVGVPMGKPRPLIACFKGLDTVEKIQAAFGVVEREVALGMLVIVEGR